jgi:hypothetical protein
MLKYVQKTRQNYPLRIRPKRTPILGIKKNHPDAIEMAANNPFSLNNPRYYDFGGFRMLVVREPIKSVTSQLSQKTTSLVIPSTGMTLKMLPCEIPNWIVNRTQAKIPHTFGFFALNESNNSAKILSIIENVLMIGNI